MISKAYAERVPEYEVDWTVGKVWYVPHHGVYHPKKNTLCVVCLTEVSHMEGFYLTKWTSNIREVLLPLPEEDRSKNLHQLDLDRDLLPVEQAFGPKWSV